MPAPLVPILIAGATGIVRVAPRVAKKLIARGAAKEAPKRSLAPQPFKKITEKQAEELASKAGAGLAGATVGTAAGFIAGEESEKRKQPLTKKEKPFTKEEEKSIIEDEEELYERDYKGGRVGKGKKMKMKKGGRVGNDYNQAAKNRPTSKSYKKKAAKYPCSHNRLY